MGPLADRRVLIFVGDDYEDLELQYPKMRLREAGAEVVVAGLEPGRVHRGKYGYPQVAEVDVNAISAAAFDGLVIPGGWMPDKLRRNETVLALTRDFHEAGKLVATICHGPWIDISAGIVAGATYTSTPGIRDDLSNAGATWVDEPVMVDGHHVSSRRPDDLPDFMRAVINVLASQPPLS